MGHLFKSLLLRKKLEGPDPRLQNTTLKEQFPFLDRINEHVSKGLQFWKNIENINETLFT